VEEGAAFVEAEDVLVADDVCSSDDFCCCICQAGRAEVCCCIHDGIDLLAADPVAEAEDEAPMEGGATPVLVTVKEVVPLVASTTGVTVAVAVDDEDEGEETAVVEAAAAAAAEEEGDDDDMTAVDAVVVAEDDGLSTEVDKDRSPRATEEEDLRTDVVVAPGCCIETIVLIEFLRLLISFLISSNTSEFKTELFMVRVSVPTLGMR